MEEKVMMWDYLILDRLCKATGYNINVIKYYVLKLAEDLGIEIAS